MTLQRYGITSDGILPNPNGMWVKFREAEAEIDFLAKRGDELAEKLTRFTKHCGVEQLQAENERLFALLRTAARQVTNDD